MIAEAVDFAVVQWMLNNGLAVAIVIAIAFFAWRVMTPAINKSVERLSTHLDRAESAMDRHAQTLDKACSTLDRINDETREQTPMIRDMHHAIVKGNKPG